ncbi:MAG: DHH family phosphoesterase [Actinomycetota bacterium]
MISDQAWRDAVALVVKAKRIAMACHVNPDGDALGSMLAVGLAARTQGVEVQASFAEPAEVPQGLRFLPGLDLIVPPDDLDPEPDLFLAFDTGSLDRLGALAKKATAAKSCIVLDHHATNDGFASVDLLDPDAAATTVVARQLLARVGWPLDTDIATCLYVGLVTDTGRFQYSNTSPEVHELAAELLSLGVKQDRISQRIYETRPLAALRVDAKALSRLKVVPQANLVWTWIGQEDIAEASAGEDELDGLIDTIRVVDGIDVALLLRERADGRWKISMRSRGDTDVGSVAASFGGGGHRLAAGATAPAEFTEPGALARAVIERLPGRKD